jgi:hypothetical protein
VQADRDVKRASRGRSSGTPSHPGSRVEYNNIHNNTDSSFIHPRVISISAYPSSGVSCDILKAFGLALSALLKYLPAVAS